MFLCDIIQPVTSGEMLAIVDTTLMFMFIEVGYFWILCLWSPLLPTLFFLFFFFLSLFCVGYCYSRVSFFVFASDKVLVLTSVVKKLL